MVGEVFVERRSGGVAALSALRARDDLCRDFSFDLEGVSGSFSLSLSRGFAEGMMGQEMLGGARVEKIVRKSV